MKFSSTVLVLSALAFFGIATARPNYVYSNEQRYNGGNFCFGRPTGNEILPKSWTPQVRYAFFGKVTVDIDLPMNSRSVGGTISYIEGLNQARCEGSVRITRGGVGYDYVTLHFEANYWSDINFNIRRHSSVCAKPAMKLLVTLVVLETLGTLQLASGYNWNKWNYTRRYHAYVPKLQTHVVHRYSNSTYVWGRQEEANRKCMMYNSSMTHITYGFVGKITADVTLPIDRQEFECPIAYIEARSLIRTAGYVCITKGGIGQRFVHIHLESNINCNLDYEIRIMGKCYIPPPPPPIPTSEPICKDICVTPCEDPCETPCEYHCDPCETHVEPPRKCCCEPPCEPTLPPCDLPCKPC
ncbi:unnamed protein product [Nezara viridula]|uniref:Uncharacterized protein n=1 Tax=Nezara viridula TaxID=85310 RepID=A0A9P0HNN8_NEZVI|nr:unnamed protein product [Nezara viridula]